MKKVKPARSLAMTKPRDARPRTIGAGAFGMLCCAALLVLPTFAPIGAAEQLGSSGSNFLPCATDGKCCDMQNVGVAATVFECTFGCDLGDWIIGETFSYLGTGWVRFSVKCEDFGIAFEDHSNFDLAHYATPCVAVSQSGEAGYCSYMAAKKNQPGPGTGTCTFAPSGTEVAFAVRCRSSPTTPACPNAQPVLAVVLCGFPNEAK